MPGKLTICGACRKEPARHILKFTVKNRLTTLYLCQACLEKKEKRMGMKPGELAFYAAPLQQQDASLENLRQPAQELRCDTCGLLYSKFKQTGLLGCQACYRNFSDQLLYVLNHIHGSTVYAGPHYAPAARSAKNSFAGVAKEVLRAELKKAVAAENFERAQLLKKALRRRT